MTTSRYEGKPLLRVLECYVLWAIGELEEKDQILLVKITPKLQNIYNQKGKWQDIVTAIMELPENMPELVKQMWEKYKDQGLTPEKFAQVFVDQNLS